MVGTKNFFSVVLPLLVGTDGLFIDLGEKALVVVQFRHVPRRDDVMTTTVIDSVQVLWK